jgi:hypothetical protein
VDVSEYQDAGLTNGTEYCYTVTQNMEDESVSGESDQACATPEAALPGDACADPFSVASLPHTITGGPIEGFTNDYASILTTPWGYDGADVVYSYTATGDGEVDISVTSDFDNALAVFTECADPAGSQIGTGTDDNGSSPYVESVTVPMMSGVTYYIVNGAYNSTATGGWTLEMSSHWLALNGIGLPDVFALHNNYPNPFNPVTNITYDIPEVAQVTLDIYNVSGQKVRTLAQGQHEPGRYRIQWNATNDYGNPLSSGMYIYRIRAGDFVSVKKLILMK